MLDSVRSRLTVWHVGVLALVLVVFCGVLYGLLARTLYARLDDDLRTTIQGIGASLVRQIGEGIPETRAGNSSLDEHIGPGEAAAIFDGDGHIIAENTAIGNIHASLPPADVIPSDEPQLYNETRTRKGMRNEWRSGVQKLTLPSENKDYFISVSEPFDAVTRELGAIRLILFLAVSVALILAGLGGWFLARRSLAPVVEMTERAHRISAENLEQRLPVANARDELGRLASTFNGLLSRLDEAFAEQRRFMADASHELRTPISVMRTATDVTLEHEKRTEGEYRDALKVIDEQARRLARIVEDMFLLARADSGRRLLYENEFYLDELLLEIGRAAEVLGKRKGVKVIVDYSQDIIYHGDEGLVRQMILNLVDNAIKHTPEGGVVRLSLRKGAQYYEIIISDTGGGIPAEARSHIFDRFYRVDKARSRATATDMGGGAGLGLSIAKWIAEAHRGRLDLRASDEVGSTFVASLPLKGVTRR